ncbi:hypothetical protein EXIGLDRAFT_762254 [Exidia glandulosa HHB12029]|uniref:F-box domain-containing protein n=1 Tax=Exidia glandulosa HHB12029 TaxID=1314781 RepID=A0A165MUT9_EXIGL|nr:hypothetical protein EXIGLDRAFT_762254 [Exidia glandulosa HHB12029]
MISLREAVLAHLDSVHNRLRLSIGCYARVNQLPVDVLLQVFAALSTKELVKATHVCYHWRHLALNTPTLWAASLHVTTTRNDMLNDLLPRSAASPLDVRLEEPHGFSPTLRRALRLLNQHTHRMRSLELEAVSPENGKHLHYRKERYFALHLNLGVPSLTTLHITWQRPEWGTHRDDLRHALSIAVPTSEAPTAGAFASLHEVTLHGAFYDIDFLLLCSRLSALDVEIPLSFTLSSLLCVITGNPALQSLKLLFSDTGSREIAATHDPWEDIPKDKAVSQCGVLGAALRNVSLAGGGRLRDSVVYVQTVLFSVFDTNEIDRITGILSTDLDRASFFAPVQPPTGLELIEDRLILTGMRGYQRSLQGEEHDLDSELLRLPHSFEHLVVLNLPVGLWIDVPTTLRALETLQISGTLAHLLQPQLQISRGYPSLRAVTFNLLTLPMRRGVPRESLILILGLLSAFVGVRITQYRRPLECLTIITPARNQRELRVATPGFPVAAIKIVPSPHPAADDPWRSARVMDDSEDESRRRRGMHEWMENRRSLNEAERLRELEESD